MLRTKDLLERETLEERDILEVTGRPPALPLESRKGVRISRREHR